MYNRFIYNSRPYGVLGTHQQGTKPLYQKQGTYYISTYELDGKSYLLAEDGTYLLTEDGSRILASQNQSIYKDKYTPRSP